MNEKKSLFDNWYLYISSSILLLYLLVCYINYTNRFTNMVYSFTPINIVIIISILVCSILLYIIGEVFHKTNPILVNKWYFFMVLSMVFYLMTDAFVGGYNIKIHISLWIVGLLISIVIIGLLLLTNKIIMSIIYGLIVIISIIQHYSVKYKGSIGTLKDLNFKHLMAVKNDYKFSLDIPIIILIIASVLTIRFILISNIIIKIKEKLCIMGIVAVCSITYICVANNFYNTYSNIVVFDNSWDNYTNVLMSTQYGTLTTLYYDTVYNKIIKPDNYSIENAKSLISNDKQTTIKNDDVLIIGILEESWADIDRLVDKDNNSLDYWKSLDSNVQKGYVTVSPYGGGTCNSEWEFLTNNSMYFLPKNTGIFTNYMNHNQDGLVSYLNSLNFRTVAYCPFDKNLWSVDTAYTYLEFDEKVFIDDMSFNENDKYKNGLVSDLALFKHLTGYINKTKSNQSEFYWVTTSQNHQPYNYTNQSEIDCYLDAVSETDTAIKWLFDYYKNYDRKVIIVIFGDHYPNIDLSNEQYKNGNKELLSHQTPYIIWTNYDTTYEWNDDMSLNYLSNDVLKRANIPLSNVQSYIETVREEIPIISSIGYKTSDNIWHTKKEDNQILNDYNILQWYRMFDY